MADFLARATRWAEQRSDVCGLALVGSWARGRPRSDSDVDLVLLTENPDLYLADDAWASELGARSVIQTRSWGVLTERRLALRSGLEVEIGVGRAEWATTIPLDRGTRKVAAAGLRVLYDRDGLLRALADEVSS